MFRMSEKQMASSSLLTYDKASVQRFEKYFTKPPRKRGRPRKKKGKVGRPRGKKATSKHCQTMVSMDDQCIDLTVKSNSTLDARLEGVCAKQLLLNQEGGIARINWDQPQRDDLRLRIADSWYLKCDLYQKGESFNKFCIRLAIDRNVLRRFLTGKYSSIQKQLKARGRPALLSKSVMKHLCEGACMLSYSNNYSICAFIMYCNNYTPSLLFVHSLYILTTTHIALCI